MPKRSVLAAGQEQREAARPDEHSTASESAPRAIDIDVGYRFGRVEFHPWRRTLRIDGAECALGSRALDLLWALVERSGELVSKRELMDRVWPGVVVDVNNLAVQIANLRRLLGSDAIATVSGLGYRFCLAPEAPQQAVSADGGAEPGAERDAPPQTLPAGAGARQLPRPLTRFIGFDDTLAHCAALLRRTRLLTLTGIGGAGKTRLSIEIAHLVADDFADGVRFIDLAPLSDPSGLGPTVAATFALQLQKDLPSEAAVLHHLAEQHCLLLLDNCEHLTDACAALVARILASAPRMQVLATSRERLSVPGEQVVAMRPMQLPTADAGDDLLAVEAVELFVSQARQAAPDFVLRDDNAQAVVDICKRLDGIPLALELAAARVSLMSVDQIRDKLGDRFRLLTRSGRSSSRHHTLLATLQWSHDQLAAQEQRLLYSLSIFSGGWTLAAAAAVAALGDELDTADMLRQLVDKSLVIADRADDGSIRYRLLETVQHFARDHLVASGAVAVTADRHLDHFIAFAQAQSDALTGRAVHQALLLLHADRLNLEAAHAWGGRAQDGPGKLLALANAMRRYWLVSSQYAHGRRFYSDALSRSADTPVSSAHGMAQFGLGQLSFFSGHTEDAAAAIDRAIAIGRQADDKRLLVVALDVDRAMRLGGADLPGARRSMAEALALARELGDPYLLGIALLGAGAQHREEADFGQALQAFTQADALMRRIGNLANLALPARNLAALYAATGRLDAARAALVDAFRLGRQSGTTHRMEQIVVVAVRIAAASGRWILAARVQGALDRYCEDIGALQAATAACLDQWEGEALRMLGEPAHTRHLAAGRGLSLDEAIAEILAWAAAPVPADDPEDDPDTASERQPLPIEALSQREAQVLDLVARGFTYAEVARRMGVTLSTVQSHARNLYGKLHVHNRTEAVFEARQLGLLR